MALLTRIDKKTLAKCAKIVLSMLEQPVAAATTTDFLSRFCSHLDLPTAVCNAAVTVVERANALGLTGGRSPVTIAAAAIFLISKLSDHPKSEREISPVANVAENTIRAAYRELW
jgi:transcription initiation factor TFIIB